jgi:hypothetical protein
MEVTNIRLVLTFVSCGNTVLSHVSADDYTYSEGLSNLDDSEDTFQTTWQFA